MKKFTCNSKPTDNYHLTAIPVSLSFREHLNFSQVIVLVLLPILYKIVVNNLSLLSLSIGLSSNMQGVVSPHELLQKLQLVQQEQILASHDPPRLGPVLAPRFLGPSQNQDAGSILGPVSNQITAGQKAALQFQVSFVYTVSSGV